MSKKKTLYIVTELDPFLQLTSDACAARELIEKSVSDGDEVRVFLARHKAILERKNRIHEIQRLNGINILMGSENKSLLVKVAPVAKTRVQAYFIDNEEMFCHRGIFHDAAGVFYPDNPDRVVFMGKSAVEILKHLAWKPDLIHCIGWPWFFTPIYGRVAHKNSFLIKKTRIVYTYGASLLKESFDFERLKHCMMPKITDIHLAPMNKKGDFSALLALSSAYSDRVFCTFRDDDTEAHQMFKKFDIPFIPHDEHMATAYRDVYRELLNSDVAAV